MSKKLSDIEKLKNKNVRELAKKAASMPKAPKEVMVEEKAKVYLGKDPLTGEKLYR